MAFSVTDFNICNTIQYHLLETPNGGVSYSSGLYITTEVSYDLNYRIKDFYKRTGLVVKHDGVNNSSIANQTDQNMPMDVIDLLRVAYPDVNGNIQPILRGSLEEETAYVGNLYGSAAAVDVPSIYTLDVSGVLQMSFFPPPNSSRVIDLTYVAQPTSLPTVPNGTLIEIPDDFTPYIKYGALADLFNKSGEVYDPFRAQICEQMYQLGIDVAKTWIEAATDEDR